MKLIQYFSLNASTHVTFATFKCNFLWLLVALDNIIRSISFKLLLFPFASISVLKYFKLVWLVTLNCSTLSSLLYSLLRLTPVTIEWYRIRIFVFRKTGFFFFKIVRYDLWKHVKLSLITSLVFSVRWIYALCTMHKVFFPPQSQHNFKQVFTSSVVPSDSIDIHIWISILCTHRTCYCQCLCWWLKLKSKRQHQNKPKRKCLIWLVSISISVNSFSLYICRIECILLENKPSMGYISLHKRVSYDIYSSFVHVCYQKRSIDVCICVRKQRIGNCLNLYKLSGK